MNTKKHNFFITAENAEQRREGLKTLRKKSSSNHELTPMNTNNNLINLIIRVYLCSFVVALKAPLRSLRPLRFNKVLGLIREIRLIRAISVLVLIGGCASLKYANGKYRLIAQREIAKTVRQINAGDRDTSLLAGAARVYITPPIGTPLGGYSARRGRPSVGIQSRLYSRALALKDDEDLLLLVSVEIVAIDDHLYEAVFDRLKKERAFSSLGREDLMLFATHTHSGPGGIGIRFLEKLSTGAYDHEVFEMIVDRISDSAIQAVRNLQSARLASGAGFVEGLSHNRMIKDGPIDPELKVIRVDDEQGNPIAFLVNFSAHPTALGKTNMHFSGDYPGELAKLVENRFPLSTMLFSCGAAADVAPDVPIEYKDLPADIKDKGLAEGLYKEMLKINENIRTGGDIEIASAGVKVPLPPARLRFSKSIYLPHILSNSLLDRYATFGLMRIGDIILAGVPCDLSAEIGIQIKQKMRRLGYDGYIIGFANDYIGYVIPERHYYSNEYESRMSFNGPQMDAYLKEIVQGLLDNLTIKRFENIKEVSVLHLSGAPYQMGFQHGIIMHDRIRDCVKSVLGYFRGYIEIPLLNKFAADVVLDTIWNKMKFFVPPEYEEEMVGIADGSGVNIKEIHRLIALSEITSSCSSFAVWGKATKDARFYQTRNLDWNIKAGAQNYPVIFVYHNKNRHSFVNIGYAGFAGVLSGINDEGIAVSEIGAKTKDSGLRGMPFVFILRKVLEESDDLIEAVNIVKSAQRTGGYNYIIGDSVTKEALALEVTRNRFAVFKDDDPSEKASLYGMPIDDAVFRSDTAFDPEVRDLQYASNGDPERPGLESPVGSSAYDIRYKRQADLIKKYYGSIDENIAINISKEVAQGSNIQSLIYAWPDIYIANAKGATPAAKTEYKSLNLQRLLSISD